MNYEDTFKNYLTLIKERNEYRVFTTVDRVEGCFPKVMATGYDIEKEVTIWSSNDSLCMSENKEVISETKRASDIYGFGTSGSRNLSGTSSHHAGLELEVADLHGKEAGLIFTSAYVANTATISTIAKLIPNLHIFSDEKNHASIIEGVSLAKCKKSIYAHNNTEDLESQLSKLSFDTPKLIIFESIYSMDGDIAPIQKICDLADKYNALTYIDEIHAVGMYGTNGAGYASKLQQSNRIDIIQAGFSKGFGTIGGYITGQKHIVDAVRSYSPGFIFTTSLPTMVVAGIRKSVSLVSNNDLLRQKLLENATYLKSLLSSYNIRFLDNATHIVPIMVDGYEIAEEIKKFLFLEKSIYLQPVNFPTVKRGEERFRAMVTVNHTKEDIDYFVSAIVESFSKFSQDEVCAKK